MAGGWWLVAGGWRKLVTSTPSDGASDGLDGFHTLDIRNKRVNIIVGQYFQGVVNEKTSGLPSSSMNNNIRIKV